MPEHLSIDPAQRALVLAGGGVRLAYHAGVLIALEEAGLRFSHVDGTSGGIFATAMTGSGIPPREQARRWRTLKLRGFIQPLPPGNYLSQRHMRALGGSDGIRRRIFPQLGISAEKIRANREVLTTFNVCNFSKKTLETVEGSAVTTDHLIAGMSLAVFSPALKIGPDWYTDAIWIRDANLTGAVQRGAMEVWVAWCIGNAPAYLNGVFNQYVHMIEISANGGLFQELSWIRDINEQRASGELPPVQVHLIRPVYPLPLDPDFFLNRIDADTLINMGYADAVRYLRNPQPLSFTDIPSVSRMDDPGLTVHFRQQFRGKWPGFQGEVVIRLGLFLRRPSEPLLEYYASVEAEGETVSGYDCRASETAPGTRTFRFCFRWQGRVLEAEVGYTLHSLPEFLWALDAKSAPVRILEGEQVLGAGRFLQGARARVLNRWHLHRSGTQSVKGARKRARGLLRTLFFAHSSSLTPKESS